MPPRKKTEAGEKAEKKPKAPAKPRKPRKAKVEPGSVGLTAAEMAEGADAGDVVARVEAAGGSVLATYREPLGGHSVVLAALPIDKVAPTPYQRELSKAHADRLAGVIPKVGRFLDPIVAVPSDEDSEVAFITPNGMHRLTAMKTLGAKSVTALVMPEREVAFRILALNTEKAHNLKDKALEVIRMARAMAADKSGGSKKKESDLALEFEQGALITLGICYEKNGRFSGGAYMPVVSRCDDLRDEPIADTLPEREELATKILELDEAVNQAVVRLKESGFTSGYLKPLVVSRINPLRWVKADKDAPKPDLEKTLAKMLEGAKKFDPGKVKAADVAAAAWMGGGEEG